MATELKTDSWHRYMLYRSNDTSLLPFASRDEKQQAADAGKKFTLAAYPDIWAKDAALVQRVRQFLGDNFHWHDRLAKSGSDLDVVQTLHDMVRGGSVVVNPEEPMRGGGGSGMLPSSKQPPVRYLSAADAAELLAWVKSIEYPPGEPVLSGPYDPSTRESLLAAARAEMPTGDDSVADATPDTSTPLGDAQPFEYTQDSIGDAEQDAASFNLSPEEQDDCMGQWERDEGDCYLFGNMMGGSRGVEMCLVRARNNYNLCMGHTQHL